MDPTPAPKPRPVFVLAPKGHHFITPESPTCSFREFSESYRGFNDLLSAAFYPLFNRGADRPPVPVKYLVYARHGRELMGFKSPVSVPMLCNTA